MSERPVNNPLLDSPALPHGAPAFDQYKTEHFLPAVTFAITQAEAEFDAIKNNKDAPTFENTIEALEFCGTELSRIMSVFEHLTHAFKEEALGDVEKEIKTACIKYHNNVALDAAIFARVKAVFEAHEGKDDLDAEQRMLLQETYKGFARSGALLDDAGKDRLREIDEKLSNLTTSFSDNTVKATASFQKIIEDEKELAGIPARVKEVYKALAEEKGEKGKWLIPLMPPPIAILEYAENRALREEIHRASTGAAYKDAHDNSEITLDIVRLRYERATLLGYKNHAAFVLEERMAGSAETVMEFLNKNQDIYMPAAKADLEKVNDFAREKDGLNDFKPWDFMFYERQLREKTFSLDMEELRPYFDLTKVMQGMFSHAEKLFNIEIKATNGTYPTWHEDVNVFEIHKDNKIIGLFYSDNYARPGLKVGGAWMNELRGRGEVGGENLIPIIANNCNFEKPLPGKSALLSQNEMITLFHEFGHGLHGLLAQGKYTSLTGTNVKWDFVELPSQVQENWAKEKEVLDTFAVHNETGEKLPSDVIGKIREMDNFIAGYMGQRQTFFSLLDMQWHTTDPANINSVEELEDSIAANSSLFPREGGTQTTRFTHLFASPVAYSSGYYSYKWAEVLDADVFARFEEKGLYDKETADRLHKLYSSGGTCDPSELFEYVMGRAPDPDALFRREGLLKNG